MDVPVSRSSYASRTADEAWESLSRMYTRARPHTSSPAAALRVDSAETRDAAVDRVWLHAAQGAFSESPDQVNIISVLDGRISLDFGRHGAAANRAGDSYLYLPDRPADLEWDTFAALAVRLPLPVVARSAAELTGLDPAALRFTSLRPLSAAAGRLWVATAKLLWQQLNVPTGRDVPPLIYPELVATVTAAALSVFPNTTMTRGYVPGPGDVRPAAVRRAVAYIDAHASLPITDTDIADAAGTTSLALRAAFRRHYDTTPLGYLRRIRLEGAHRDLQATEPTGPTGVAADEAIATIAARWGFTDAARFTAAYCGRYGVPPGRTLRS